jgi:hypothetical protein
MQYGMKKMEARDKENESNPVLEKLRMAIT